MTVKSKATDAPIAEALDLLTEKISALSLKVESSVKTAVKSIRERNASLAASVIEGDREIDAHEIEVEEECLKIMALHQPVALDLRYVVSSLKINNDLERIGDLAANIANKSKFISTQEEVNFPFDFEAMAENTLKMLRKSLKSFALKDVERARWVCQADEQIDEIHRNMYETIYAETKQNPQQIKVLIAYLSISRCLERIADYTTNIAEDVIYMVEGNIVRHNAELEV